MAAIDGIASASSTASTVNYQVKEVTKTEPVQQTEPQAYAGSADIAATVPTVMAKDKDSNPDNNNTKQDGEKKDASMEQIKKAVSDLNKRMKNTSCEYGIHDGTNRVTIKIVDKNTKDVIKEYPAEETLDMIAKAWELAGLMVDKRL